MPTVHLGDGRPSQPNPEGDTDTPLTEVLAVVKPRLRGWLHAGMAPLALAAGIVLISLAATPAGVVGGAIFLTASVLLFGTSAVYHRGTWGTLGQAILRRLTLLRRDPGHIGCQQIHGGSLVRQLHPGRPHPAGSGIEGLSPAGSGKHSACGGSRCRALLRVRP